MAFISWLKNIWCLFFRVECQNAWLWPILCWINWSVFFSHSLYFMILLIKIKKKLFFRNINMRSVTLSATGFFFFFLRLLKFLSCTELVDRMQVCSAAYWDSGSRTCWVHSSARVIAAPDRTPSLTAASYFLSTPLGQKKKKTFIKMDALLWGIHAFETVNTYPINK